MGKLKNNPKNLAEIRMGKCMAYLSMKRLPVDGICTSVMAQTSMPPTPLQTFRVFPQIAGMFIPSEADKKAYEKLKLKIAKAEYLRYPATIPHDKVYRESYLDSYSPPKNKKKIKYCERPPKIVYDEDLIRHKFYEDHPCELDRPIDLNEYEHSAEDIKWYSTADESLGSRLDSEFVIRNTLALEEKKNISRSEAYRQSLKKFYAIRYIEDSTNESHINLALKAGQKLCEKYNRFSCGIKIRGQRQKNFDAIEEAYVTAIRNSEQS